MKSQELDLSDKAKIIELLTNHQSIKGMSLEDVFDITEAATDLVKTELEGLNESYLERLVRYNEEAISLFIKDPSKIYHFYSRLAETYKGLYKKKKNKLIEDGLDSELIKIAEMWYYAGENSANQSRFTNEKHYAHSCILQADAAKTIFFLLKGSNVKERKIKSGWGIKWYNARIEAAETYNVLKDEKNFLYMRSSAGQAAQSMYEFTKHQGWRQKALEHYNDFIHNFKPVSDYDEKKLQRVKASLTHLIKTV